MDEFLSSSRKEEVENAESSSLSGAVRWIPPPAGWIKINVDAAYKASRAAAAMVVRDDSGKLLFLSSTLLELDCHSPFEAELEALNWASGIAERGGWVKAF